MCVIECIYVLLVVYLIKLNIFILSKLIIFFYLIGGVGGNGGGVICLQVEMNVIIFGKVVVNGGNGGNIVW